MTDAKLKKLVLDVFKKYDADQSNTLDKNELRAFLVETIGEGFNEQEFDATFAKMDKDNSGSLSKSEVLAFFKEMLQ